MKWINIQKTILSYFNKSDVISDDNISNNNLESNIENPEVLTKKKRVYWLKEFDWLYINLATEKMFCTTCIEFNPMEKPNTFIEGMI